MTIEQRGEEESGRSQRRSSSMPPSWPKIPTTNAPHRERLKLPQISQFSIAFYTGFIALAALYVAHSSANTSADAAILANKIAIAGLSQAQAANQIQLLQLCLLNSTLLTDPCDAILAPAAGLIPNIAALANSQSDSAEVNGQIEARFVRELKGFHGAFFTLLGIAVIHVACSLLWRPAKDCLRRRRVARHRSDNELPSKGPEDGVPSGDEPITLRAMGPDHDGEW